MSREGDHVRGLFAAAVEEADASQTAAAMLALAVVVEQQGVAAGQAIADGLEHVAVILDRIHGELTALSYAANQTRAAS
jgi:hypothetical protein